MGELLAVYLAVTLPGWAVYPLLHRALGRLPDRGYAVSRCFGLFLSSWLSFLIVGLTGKPLSTWLALGAVVLVGLLAYGVVSLLGPGQPAGTGARGIVTFPQGSASVVVCAELIFLAGLVIFSWILRHDPAVDPDSERFMDYAFLKAYLRSPGLPVADPWFAGEPMNYYHFGYAAAAFLVRAAGLPASRALIPVIAVFHALLWSGAFCIGLALTGRRRGGIAAALLVLGAGNFEWIRQLFRQRSLLPFDWFEPSRVIAGAISEFPWFSLLWGDLHPYVMALPLLLCALAFIVAEAIGQEVVPDVGSTVARTLAFSFAAGALLVAHPWDVPFLILAASAAIACGGGRHRPARVAIYGLAAVMGAILFLPFMAGLRQGGRTFSPVPHRSTSLELLMAFGPFVLIALLLPIGCRAGRRDASEESSRPEDDRAAIRHRIALALASVGVLSIVTCEIVYVRDFFSGTDLSRMNTVFKLHRIAWTLLGITAPALMGQCVSARTRFFGRGGRVAFVCALLLVAATAGVYPVLGTHSWLLSRRLAQAAVPGADAEARFRALFPGDAAVAAWLEDRAAPGEIVLEETGEAYSWSSRIATFSGVPTVLGWGNHEAGWRDDWVPILERRRETETIYRAPASEQAKEIITRRRIAWIVMGERERRRYGGEGSTFLSTIATKILDVDGTALYRVGPGTAP